MRRTLFPTLQILGGPSRRPGPVARTASLRSRPAFALTALALMLSAPLSAADRLHAGQWEFTTTRTGETPNSFKHCVQGDDALLANGDTKAARAIAEKKAAGRCTISEYSVTGNVVTYAMKCGKVSLRSKATYAGDSSEGELVSKNGTDPETVSHIKARRIGDCP